MRVLVGCEESGIVRRAFRAKGHDAWSCDILPTIDQDSHHIQDDILNHLIGWDAIIAFPPCTYLTRANNGSFYNDQVRMEFNAKKEAARQFVIRIYEAAPIAAIENPVGCLSTQWKKPSQIIQPYQFGDPWVKETCLWLKGLAPLKWTNWVGAKGYWHLATRDPRIRSRTFPGVAQAMADQWG